MALIARETDVDLGKASRLAQEISNIYARWREWLDICEGRHGCHHELCSCERTIAFARLHGWDDSPPPLPATPLPSSPGETN